MPNVKIPSKFAQTIVLWWMAAFLFLSQVCFINFSWADSNSGKHFEEYKEKIVELGKAREFDEALIRLESAKQEFRGDKSLLAALYYYLGMGYYEAERFSQAKVLLEETTKQYPSYHWLWALYARVLAKSGEKDKASAILMRYPSKLDSFSDDLAKTPINMLTAYNLAAAYVLLNDQDLAISYLSAFWFSDNIDLKNKFEQVNSDPDFSSLHDDVRYLFVQDTAYAETFDDSVTMLEDYLDQMHAVIVQFYHNETSVDAVDTTIKKLQQIRNDVSSINTVAPVLMDIQQRVVDYITKANRSILEGGSRPIPGQVPDSLEKIYLTLVSDIKEAERSQTEII